MVKGSTIQLISKGQQDLFLTGNPKITFWKMVYRRHTQFAIESIRNNFNIKPVFGETIVSEIKRSGDLLNKMYFVVTLPPLITSEIFKENPDSGRKKACLLHAIGAAGRPGRPSRLLREMDT